MMEEIRIIKITRDEFPRRHRSEGTIILTLLQVVETGDLPKIKKEEGIEEFELWSISASKGLWFSVAL